MPITANAKKALRQQKSRTTRNSVVRSQIRTVVKKTLKQPSESLLSAAFSTVDKAVKRHIIHKNKAAHLKSQLTKNASQPETKAQKTVKKATKSKVKKTKKTK